MNRRDMRVGDALNRLDVPEHAPDFFERLDSALDEMDAEETKMTTHRRPRRTGLLTAAAVVTLGVAVYALATAFPGAVPDRIAERITPQIASAAEVTAQIRDAITTTRTLRGGLVIVERDEPGAPTREVRYEFAATSAGDFRLSGENTMPDGTTIAEEVAFDAAAGIERRTTDDGAFPMAIERTGVAPGMPDDDASDWVLQRRLGALLRALDAATDGAVAESTHEGRDVWVLDLTVEPNLIAPFSADRLEVTVDRETGFPLRVVETREGELVREMRLEALEVDAELAPDTFALTFPEGVEVGRMDEGFRRVTLGEVHGAAGYVPLAPQWLPDGFELADVAVAGEAQATGLEGMNPVSRGVVSLVYRNGFDRIVVTTRLAGADASAWSDPLASGEGYLDEPVTAVLADGAMAGASAELLVDGRSVPHLWAIGDGLVLTISGDGSAEEFVRIAESLAVNL